MKKYFLILIISMVINSNMTLDVFAEKKNKEIKEEVNEEYLIKETPKILNKGLNHLYKSDINIKASYYSEQDQKQYQIEKIDNNIYAFDQNGNLVGSLELVSTIQDYAIPRAGWSGWYLCGQDNFTIDIVAQTTVSVIAGLVFATIPGGYGITISSLSTIASAIKSLGEGEHRVYNKYLQSGYSSCGILVKNKVQAYKNSSFTSQLGGEVIGEAHWEGNPYDMTQPSACRELLSSYPY